MASGAGSFAGRACEPERRAWTDFGFGAFGEPAKPEQRDSKRKREEFFERLHRLDS